VDLGCGNGLLTYLLNKEGYQGYGVDMADRRIWEKLCKDENKSDMLRGKEENNDGVIQTDILFIYIVEALYPSSVTYKADWIIGNHADELVPW
jgi:predicted TPR repeat methyltransferase